MATKEQFNPYFFHAQLQQKLLELVLLCDDFAQLKVLSEIADLFYTSANPKYNEIYSHFENQSRKLAHLPEIGANEPLFCCPGDDCAIYPCPK